MNSNPPTNNGRSNGLTLLLVSLGIVLLVLFYRSLNSDMIIFANDGPLGAMKAVANQVPGTFFGSWQDLNWLGNAAVNPAPDFSMLLLAATSPELYLKVYVPFALIFLGISTWLFFRQLKFAPVVCALGGIAAALNMNFFSNASWGQTSRPISLAAAFLAMAAVVSAQQGPRAWLKIILAGLAVGLGVSEGFDVGVLFSFCVAAFVIFLSFTTAEPVTKQLGKNVARLIVVVIFSGLMAAQTITALLGTELKGTMATGEPAETKTAAEKAAEKDAKWDFSTQFSNAKMETLRVIIPGLYGYRMDTQNGGQYWGSAGQTPGVPTSRFNGSGEYAGLLVVILAILAMANSFRKQKNPFTVGEKKLVWFWAALALVSLLLAFGRYAPFYQLIYPLPFFNTIRNPMKFMHLFQLAFLVLFGYGAQALYRQYLEMAVAKAPSFSAQWKKWWGIASGFEKKFVYGLFALVAISLLGWMIYGSSRKGMESYFQTLGFSPALAAMTFKFSSHEIAMYLLFLVLSVGAILAIMTGWFSGQRAKWAGLLLVLILTVDLARANAPWILYWKASYKYATNPIIDILKEKPYEHRVEMFDMAKIQQLELLQQVFAIEWHQHHFQYYNVQSLRPIQNPRPDPKEQIYKMALLRQGPAGVIREWELSNTRYILGMAGNFVDALNQQLDPGKQRFKIHTPFAILPKAGVSQAREYQDLTAVLDSNGPYALLEFTGALPRAKLYSNWQVSPSDTNTLEQIASPAFNPFNTVVVSSNSVLTNSSSAITDAGQVEFESYSPKKITLSANATTAAVLLLNDHYHPGWKVTVDGKPETLLRCNYIVRGVHLQPGRHQIVFKFEADTRPFYVSLAATVLGVGLCGFLFVSRKKSEDKKTPATS